MFEAEKRQIIRVGMQLDKYGLIALSGGNVSCRAGENFLVTPSGMIYEELQAADILLLDARGRVLEGERRPSVDTEALLYIYAHMPAVQAIIHTHQAYATAVGLVADELPAAVTTLANAAKGRVRVSPYASAASVDMGRAVVEYLGKSLAVILKHHGVITVGDSLKQALYAAVYLEEAAKTYWIACGMGTPAVLNEEQIQEAVEVFHHYGQKA